MDQSNVKFYQLKNGMIVVGKLSENHEYLLDILKIAFIPIQVQGQIQMQGDVTPMGYPMNKKPVDLAIDDLGILFEIEVTPSDIIMYDNILDQILNPTIIKPKSGLILN